MRQRAPILVVLLLAATLPLGCDTGSASAEGSSCIRGDAALCVDLLAVSSNLVAQATCLDVLGPDSSFAVGMPCSADLGVGLCDVVDPDVRFSIQYSAPVFTTGDASADCAGRGGTFHPQTFPGQAP